MVQKIQSFGIECAISAGIPEEHVRLCQNKKRMFKYAQSSKGHHEGQLSDRHYSSFSLTT